MIILKHKSRRKGKKELQNLFFKKAKEHNIPCRTKKEKLEVLNTPYTYIGNPHKIKLHNFNHNNTD